MDLTRKLAILADAAKYDASCASSGTTSRNSLDGRGIGSTDGSGICHSHTPDGRCVSLLKVLPAVLGCAADRFDCLALVKPQFEVGRGSVGKGGVVRDAALRLQTLVSVGKVAHGLGAAVMGYAGSGLSGPKGNRETFAWLAEPERGGVDDLEAAAGKAEL